MKTRVVYKQAIKPECVDTYLEYHRNVWPELEQAYREAGITDLSCFVLGTELLVYLEYDEERYATGKERLKENDVEQRWQALMNGLKDADAGSVEFGEVYRFPLG